MTDKITVIHSDGTTESFKPRRIGQAIVNETGVDEELAYRIQKRIADKFYKLKKDGLGEVSTSQIRAEVSAHLLNEGRFTDAEGTLQMGLTKKQVDELLKNHSTENANNNDNSESLYKRVAEKTLEEYTFSRLPDYISDAHINGYIHLHDRADFFIKPNCVSGNNNVIVKDKDNIVSYIRMDDLVSEFEINDDFYYEVPTLNIEKNIVEWKPIINAWCTGEDEVFKVSFGKGYSIECTNDHKFIKSSSNSPCKDYDIQVKEFDGYKDLRLCNITDIYRYNEDNDYHLSALFGFFLGDGHLDNDTGLVKFTFAKKDKVDYIISLLDKLQLNYNKTDYKTDRYTGGYVYHITITDCIYPKLSKEELIKRFKKTLNLKGVLEGLIASDGGLRLDIGNSLKLYFNNTNKAIFDLYHLCLISQGIRGSTHYKKPVTYYDNALHCEKTMQKGVYMSSSFGESVIKLVNSITIRKKHEEAIKDFNKNPKKYSVISELQPKSIEYIGEQKVYNLTIQDNHNYMCGINGFVLVQNCFSYSIPWLLENGFSPDGDRKLGATSKPPKHFDTLMNLMHELLGCGKIDLSGGQNFPHANVYLAPCSANLSYNELKQNLQSLLFNLNQAIMSKGEVVFSSMGWDLEVPSYMKDEDAIGLGGVVVGKYGDYEDEAKRILKIWCELLQEGDSRGVPFRFPNNIFALRDDYENSIDEQLYWICEYLCKFPTGYFSNDDLPNTGGISTIMGALTIDTPVMTDKGFKYPNDLRIGDNVMTYSSEDGSKSWNKIYNIIEKEAPAKVFKITCDNGYSFKVTDNHKLPTIDGIVKSEDLKVGMELYDYVDEPYTSSLDYEKEFIGIFLADGFIRHKPKHQENSNYIEFHIRKQWKKDHIEHICKELDYDYEIKTRKDGSYSIHVKELELRNELVKLYDDDLGIKRFPSEYWNDKNAIANILMGLMFDGRKDGVRWTWSSSSKELVYDVCYAISYLGMKSKIYKDIRKGKTGNWKTNYSISLGKDFAPKLTTKIKSIEIVENTEPVYDLSVENNPNYVCGLGGIHSENCRTRNTNADPRWSWQDNTLNNGNLAFHSLNLPLFALESENIDEFYELLTKYCNIALDALCLRRRVIEDRLANDKLPFLTWRDKKTGRTLYEVERTTLSVGYVGLNETIKELTNGEEDITTDAGVKLGVDIINYIQKLCDKRKQETGYKIGVVSSPAESTAYRFAKYNKKLYPKAYINGKGDDIFYTNSHHIQVAKDVSLTDHLKNAETFHKLTPFGAICHVFLGTKPTVESLVKLTKLIKKHDIGFWSYTLDFTICNDCQQTFLQALDECPNCGSKALTVYSKITGYYVPVYQQDDNGERHRQWNDGKIGEFNERKKFTL